MTFGRALRTLWPLAADGTFLNHGSFGACPNAVLAEQQRLRADMESQPDRFFRDRVMPREGATALRDAIGRLASFVGTQPDRLALLENATAGVQAVVRSVPLDRGDEILITDHTYNAVRLIVEARCAETGATPRVVALGLARTADEIVQRFRDAVTPRVRIAIIDHITSPTALAMPVAALLPELRRWDAKVLVDGAHAAGHLPLDVDALGADWYVSNAHKWLFAPRGTAFLHASPAVAKMTQPLVTSHFVGMGFPRSFDWAGTRDYTAWLALPAALAFFASLGVDEASRYRASLIRHATTRLGTIGAKPVAADELSCAMRSFVLPQRTPATQADADAWVAMLWDRHRIQAMAVMFAGTLLLRVSAQVYVGEEDVEALVDALAAEGWPGMR